jgi:Bacterial sugar transferase
MSVVGPRPHLVEHNDKFAELLSNYHTRAFVKPGITGLAQVRGFRGEATTREAIAARLRSDLIYLENWSLILDLSIIIRTAWHVFVPPNCCPTKSKQIPQVNFSTERGAQQREEPGKGAIPAADHAEKTHPKSYFGSLWDDGEFPKSTNRHASKRSGDLS